MWLRRNDMQAEFAQITRRALSEATSTDDVRAGWPGPLRDLGPWKVAEGLGWLDLVTPEDRGGLGLGYVELGIVFEEAGRALFPGPLFGSAVVRPRLASLGHEMNERVLAAGLSAATAPRGTPGVLMGTRVTGRWDLVESPADAESVLLDVHDDGQTALVLVAGTQVNATPVPSMDPVLRLHDLVCDDVPGTVIARGTDADSWLAQTTSAAHALYAARMLGVAEAMLEMARDYATTRQQFGRPIGSFQALQHLLADLQVAVATGRASAYVAQAALASGRSDAAHRARVANAHLSVVAREVAEGSLQVMGGIGFTAEHDLHLYYKHALTLQGLWGDQLDHQDHLGRLLAARMRRGAEAPGAPA